MADAPYSQNIRQLTKDSYDNSAAHGFWDSEVTAETIPSKLALIHSEVSEALESYRNPESDNLVPVPASLLERVLLPWLEEDWATITTDGSEVRNEWEAAGQEVVDLYRKWQTKPKGIDIELADILIRVFDFAGHEGIDLDAALKRKMDYNKSRPFRHNRKV